MDSKRSFIFRTRKGQLKMFGHITRENGFGQHDILKSRVTEEQRIAYVTSLCESFASQGLGRIAKRKP